MRIGLKVQKFNLTAEGLAVLVGDGHDGLAGGRHAGLRNVCHHSGVDVGNLINSTVLYRSREIIFIKNFQRFCFEKLS
jgi:hypothetical protein